MSSRAATETMVIWKGLLFPFRTAGAFHIYPFQRRESLPLSVAVADAVMNKTGKLVFSSPVPEDLRTSFQIGNPHNHQSVPYPGIVPPGS